jgi:hypothetical protein
MSLDIEQKLRVFFASAPQVIHKIDTLEISHSQMSKVYYLWREPYNGEITTEDGVRTVQPVNFQVKPAGSQQNLDQVYAIALDTVDIEDDFRAEMDRVAINTSEFVRCVFREYLSDDLTDPLSRAVLQVESVSYKVGAASISAVTPRLNITRTGELYTVRDIPMLRSFV